MILCCGEALIDMVPADLDGRTVFLPCPGGSPYNTAIAIGRLGAPVCFLGRLSRDFFGEMLIERLKQNKVGTELIIRSDQNSSLALVKLEPGREPQYLFYTEDTADRSFSPGDIPPQLPPELRCILFGSIAMTMEPVASTIEALIRRESARTEGPLISVDPNVRPFMIPHREAYAKRFEGWLALAAIVKISQADFDFIYPNLGLEKSLQRVIDSGPRMVVVTLGQEGALALLRRNDGALVRVSAPVIEVPVVDTIGAGDTFHGALLSWLELGGKMSPQALGELTEEELYGALLFANKAASLVCARRGAEPPSMAEVEALSPGGE
ncbi:MAG: carbohydrate kinase [Treponema sp.]|jgi:fructokinase|nr:carbohydrate kinase [Treponema sp.]